MSEKVSVDRSDGSIAFQWGDQQFGAGFSDNPKAVVNALTALANFIQKALDEGKLDDAEPRRPLHG